MSFFKCPHCEHDTHIFGKDGVLKTANQLQVDVLANIPLHADVCETSDSGSPITISKPASLHSQTYKELASKIIVSNFLIFFCIILVDSFFSH